MQVLKFINSLIAACLFIFIIGTAIAHCLNISPLVPCLVLSAATLLFSFLYRLDHRLLRDGVHVDIWTGELVENFRQDKTWLGRIKRRDDIVNNDVIHLVDVGADPAVLINNTTYPINTAERSDQDIAITLDKFDTENTRVTKDELHAISFDKMASVIDSHNAALEDKTGEKAAHALQPANSNAIESPVVLTTGINDGRINTRKRLTSGDIITAKERLDTLKVPRTGRILVLCPEHATDLLRTDEVFEKQYKNMRTGEILSLYGFDIYEFNSGTKYLKNGSILTKKAFGAVTEPALDLQSSFFFYNERAFQAVGSVEMFYKDASIDTEYRENKVGFRMYHICLPKKWTGFGAIVSDAIA